MERNWICRFCHWFWVSGTGPQGAGTLLIGIAALVTLYQTGGVLEKILEIRVVVNEIKTAVAELKTYNEARKFSGYYFQEPNLTIEQIKNAIKNIPSSPSNQSSVYLPEEKRAQVIKDLENKTPEQREVILQNSLIYQSQSDLKK